ncbi:response regulator transcription factor [Micromonospora endophytica]|uniref:Uncharacterized protein n=1 Tax=Micromonospora endophytica TaxID=515350 RepID=A0A2W2DEV7_9ACTN|nr:response regulator transcription factor [Micromonospora endophytica]PZF91223.1 hypothetical protein C1I93_21835 [Micromonospora endophytica]RIW51355.1 DNA-binding response regulator [Micromonospora endophytica]BCJ62039.1 hypothetical protein Jiend_54610 [Micromonospora endophytica]
MSDVNGARSNDTGADPGSRTTAVTALIVHAGAPERAALRAMLDTGGRVRVVAATGDGDEAVALAHRLRPTVTLLDDGVTASGHWNLVDALAQRSPVIVMTGATDCPTIASLLRTPVRGCLVHGHFDAAELLGAVSAVAAGLGWLSPTAVAAASWALRTRAPGCSDRPGAAYHGSSQQVVAAVQDPPRGPQRVERP